MKVYVTSNEPVYSELGEPIRWGGRYSKNLADALHSLGHEVVLIAPADSYELVQKFPYPVRPMVISNDDVSYKHIDYNLPVFASHPVSTQTFLQMLGVSADRYLMSQAWAMSTSELFFGRPDVVINTGASTWNYISSAYPTAVVTHANDLLDKFEGSELEEVARVGLARSFIAIASNKMASRKYNSLALRGGYPEQVALIQGAIRTEQLKVDGRVEAKVDLLSRYHEELLGVSSYDFWVVHSCELAGAEGVAGLVLAAQEYETYLGANVSTIIIGLDADTEARLKGVVADMEIEGVNFVGKLKEEADLGRFIGEAHVVTFSSGREGVGMLYADSVNHEVLAFDGSVVDIADVTARVERVDAGSVAVLRLARELARHNTELRSDLMMGLLNCLNHELRVALNLGNMKKQLTFSNEIIELSMNYRRFAAQEIATDSLLDGVVTGVRRFIPGEVPNNDRVLDLVTQHFGLDVFGRRFGKLLKKIKEKGIRDDRPRRSRVNWDREARLNSVGPDTRVMREFDYLREAVGTDQFPKAMRRFDRAVMTYLGMRATYSHQHDIGAIADPRLVSNGIFAEIARAAGVNLKDFNEVLFEVSKMPASEIMGREYGRPMRRKAKIVHIDTLKRGR